MQTIGVFQLGLSDVELESLADAIQLDPVAVPIGEHRTIQIIGARGVHLTKPFQPVTAQGHDPFTAGLRLE